MEINELAKRWVGDIHSCVVATLDEQGQPITRMLYDEKSVYFLTVKSLF